MKTNNAKIILQQDLVLTICFHWCNIFFTAVFRISRQALQASGLTNEITLSKLRRRNTAARSI